MRLPLSNPINFSSHNGTGTGSHCPLLLTSSKLSMRHHSLEKPKTQAARLLGPSSRAAGWLGKGPHSFCCCSPRHGDVAGVTLEMLDFQWPVTHQAVAPAACLHLPTGHHQTASEPRTAGAPYLQSAASTDVLFHLL